MSAIVILLIIIIIVTSTVPLQKIILEEALRQEKAQLTAENIFWQTIDETSLKNLPNTFSLDYKVKIDNQTYIVTITAEKLRRRK
ncbi:MAG: hypothetical protein N2Z58_06305 [Fervidobacterium sp.]|nr:hypothetical protein [Fervidobacterium sp.]